MKLGVYVDGYNLYYGGRSHFGRGTPGWRWFDPRRLAQSVLNGQITYALQQGLNDMASQWATASITRVVYCTARIDAKQNPGAQFDQDVYLKALVAANAVDHIEYGAYVSRVKSAPVATKDPTTQRPVIVSSNWPLMVKDSSRQDVPGASFLVSYLHNEEKGSDVNVATHVLRDVLTGAVDGVVVISNDSDLRLPIEEAKQRVPVGIVNPGTSRPAGALKCATNSGSFHHWNRNLVPGDFTGSQMNDPVAKYAKPTGW